MKAKWDELDNGLKPIGPFIEGLHAPGTLLGCVVDNVVGAKDPASALRRCFSHSPGGEKAMNIIWDIIGDIMIKVTAVFCS